LATRKSGWYVAHIHFKLIFSILLESLRAHANDGVACSGISFNLIALLFLTHAFLPRARAHTVKFFKLSYYNPRTGQYAAGHDDFYFIIFYTVLLTGLRAAVMDHILTPLAKVRGVSRTKDAVRFAEQAWMLIYYVFCWPLGVVCFLRQDGTY
jgi:acyl-CoA-dependent ceramide synthase